MHLTPVNPFVQRRPATQETHRLPQPWDPLQPPHPNYHRNPSLDSVLAYSTIYQVYRNTYLCNLCLMTLTVSFAADLYPGVPSHNVPLSAALLWASCNVDGVRALRRRSFAYALSALVLISLFIDVDFLASALKVSECAHTHKHSALCSSAPSEVVKTPRQLMV